MKEESMTYTNGAIISLQGDITAAENAAKTYTNSQISPVKTEVENARSGSVTLNARIDNINSTAQSVKTEVENARAGQPNLTARLLDMNSVLTNVDAELIGVKAAMNVIANTLIPVGSTVPYAGLNAPTKWLLCEGQAVSRSTYSQLFTVLGTRFGAGNGSTTFNLPDLRSRVPVGKDGYDTPYAAVGNTGGAKEHTLTVNEIPAHSHNILLSDTTAGVTNEVSLNQWSRSNLNQAYQYTVRSIVS